MKALLLCASHNDLGLVMSLRKLGYEILVIGSIANQPGEKYADQYIQMDYSDKDAVLKLAIEEKIDVICQCCNDFGVYTAAYVAEKLNLPGYDSYETTLLLHNKDRFKTFAEENGICTPKAVLFDNIIDARTYLSEAEYPLIIKPTDASAGNGISKVATKEEGVIAVEKAFQKTRAGRIVIEPYISGTQHGFCTFLVNQKVVACCSNNEYSVINPYRVEIDTYPTDNYENVSGFLIEQIERIAEILQLRDGIFHLQYIMDERTHKPQIIEVMRRILGNMYSIPASKLNGIDWDYWETRAKCGLSCSDFPQNVRQEGYFAYKTILASANGVIKDIMIPKEYRKYLTDQFILKKAGDTIERYEAEPVGFLFFIFASQEEMKKVLIENYRNDLVTI